MIGMVVVVLIVPIPEARIEPVVPVEPITGIATIPAAARLVEEVIHSGPHAAEAHAHTLRGVRMENALLGNPHLAVQFASG
jgi:hypothetical protein